MASRDAVTYDTSPASEDRHVTADEVGEILEMAPKAFAKDPARVNHFVRRVGLTLAAYRDQIQRLHHDVKQANMAKATGGAASTLSPLDAIRFVRPDQLEGILDGHMAEKMAAINRTQADAEAAKSEAVREVNNIRLAVAEAVDDPTLDRRARDRFSQLLSQLAATEPAAGQPDTSSDQDGALDGLFD